jgi:hypothetical protein
VGDSTLLKFRLPGTDTVTEPALRGLTGRAVTSQDFGAVGAAGGGGAVGVQGDGPAPLVDGDVMVEETLCRPRDYADLAVKPLVAAVNGLGRSA